MTPLKRPLAAILAAWMGMSGVLPAHADLTDIANIPLAESSAESVPPNIYFILDDSGSMGWDYMPDYVDDSSMCPDADANGNRNSCVVGDPPYSVNAINGVYYNPATRYRPPKGADGNEWANASSTTPLIDPFTGSTSTKTLSSYQNTAWCKNSWDTPNGTPDVTGNAADDSNCRYYPLNTDITDYPRYPDGTYIHRRTYNGPPVYYTLSGAVQWCTTSALTTCVTRRDGSHTYPKFTGTAEVTGVAASRSFYVVAAGNTSGTKTKTITYDGTAIASITVNYSANNKTNRIDLAQKVITAINGVAGWTATLLQNDTSASESGTGGSDCKDSTRTTRCARIQVTAPGGAASITNTNYNSKNFTVNEGNNIDFNQSSANLSGGVNYSAASAGAIFRRIQIKSAETYTKYAARGDCSGASCTGAQELQNFANWYSFYRTRMLMMKTGTSRAFAGLDDNYRLAYSTISYEGVDDANDEFLGMKLLTPSHKTDWYAKLFGANPSNYTSLRAALSKAGRYYAGALGGTDPITHSCQQNFTILSTDGYWNTNEENPSNQNNAATYVYGPIKPDGTSVGDQDGVASATLPSKDALAKPNTLADVAYYYYHTDLRTSGALSGNNVPRAGTNNNTDDIATHQHMTTFTVGLGVDGTLRYVSDYKTNTSTSNDYYNILQGTAQWPDPITNTGDQRIDDLWHAAVNGRGTYFSARDPDSLVDGLQKALSSISMSQGSGAAAATSNLEPVAGDNFIYVGSYRTQAWDGDLAGHLIDISTGAVSITPSWQASTLLNTRIASTGDSDTRTIYSYDAAAATKLESFTWANLDTTQRNYFNNALLSQYADWDAATQAAATGEMLLQYVRGFNRNENQDRPGDYGAHYRLYRDRAYILGDLVHSQPVYVKKPPFDYGDTGYAAFKSAEAGRTGAVYVASNDGMVHAFNAQTGDELWAYVPPQVLPNLYKLADQDFTNSHQFFVDASPVVGDAYIDGAWKTIMVGGFGKGARGYYALDITDPAAPKALWNFSEDDLGYSFGNAIITKLEGSSQWVVVIPSGYNNVSPGDGLGHVWVLDAGTGAVVRKINTTSGSTSSPSGLAHLTNWVQNGNLNNSTQYAYGGDLNGKVWKFDIVAGTSTLVANFGSSQPITAAIELGLIDANRVLFFGTGRYLGQTDTGNTDDQAIYAIKDQLSDPENPKTNLVQQQLLAIDGSTRTTTENEVNWSTKEGWYIDLPDDKERVNLPAILQLGTLIIVSNVPNATACTPGGYSWAYNLDPRYGTFVGAGSNTVAGTKFTNITVGFNVVKLSDGRVIIYRTGHNDPVPQPIDAVISQASAGGIRINWREIIE